MQVLTTSPWIPREWLQAHGFEPRVAWGLACVSGPGSASGVRHLSEGLGQGVCAFAQHCVDAARQHPAMPMIMDSSCDQLRRSFDALIAARRPQVFLFNLPAAMESPAAGRIFRSELNRLGRWLVQDLGGSTPARDELIRLIQAARQARLQLLESAENCPARRHAEAIGSFLGRGAVELSPPPVPSPAAGIPVALVGGHFPVSQWSLLDRIEEWGGRVVLNATLAGERALGASFDGDSGDSNLDDPVEFFVERYLRSAIDAYQRPNHRLYHWLHDRLQSRSARGIILWSFMACDLWRAEAQTMKERLNLPVCLLEGDGADGCSARTAGRIQAFLESLRCT